MKLPKPLFDEPCGKSSPKTQKKRKKPRATAVYNVLSGEVPEQLRYRHHVDPELPEHPDIEEEPADGLREFVRDALMPGAIVYTSDEDSAELCERLGIEARHAGDEGDEEEADLD